MSAFRNVYNLFHSTCFPCCQQDEKEQEIRLPAFEPRHEFPQRVSSRISDVSIAENVVTSESFFDASSIAKLIDINKKASENSDKATQRSCWKNIRSKVIVEALLRADKNSAQQLFDVVEVYAPVQKLKRLKVKLNRANILSKEWDAQLSRRINSKKKDGNTAPQQSVMKPVEKTDMKIEVDSVLNIPPLNLSTVKARENRLASARLSSASTKPDFISELEEATSKRAARVNYEDSTYRSQPETRSTDCSWYDKKSPREEIEQERARSRHTFSHTPVEQPSAADAVFGRELTAAEKKLTPEQKQAMRNREQERKNIASAPPVAPPRLESVYIEELQHKLEQRRSEATVAAY